MNKLKQWAQGKDNTSEWLKTVVNSMWIPCSRGLPSEFSELSDDERVLATTEVDGLGVILIPAYDVESWYRKGYITAWMPLPEPWKGADDD